MAKKKMNKHYRERFHVDAVTAAKDLQEIPKIIDFQATHLEATGDFIFQ